MHDFIVSSSQEGLEGVKEGKTIDIPTRTVRTRRQGDTGMSESHVHLPMLKSAVYVILERLTAEWRADLTTSFVCFLDNLFMDVHLARALLTLGIGICGTTRKNAPGIPPVLVAITHKFPKILPKDTSITMIVDELVNVTTWHDGERGKVVRFITTVHAVGAIRKAIRKTKTKLRTRGHANGYAKSLIDQTDVAVDYNDYMGATDNSNHLRATATIRRPGQPKWTKKFLEFIVDICQTNAYLIWKRHHQDGQAGHRKRAVFLQELIAGLLIGQGEQHVSIQRGKRLLCVWKDCRTRGYAKRQVLGEITNRRDQIHHSKTQDWCLQCEKPLCICKGCFRAYHEANRLQTEV